MFAGTCIVVSKLNHVNKSHMKELAQVLRLWGFTFPASSPHSDKTDRRLAPHPIRSHFLLIHLPSFIYLFLINSLTPFWMRWQKKKDERSFPCPLCSRLSAQRTKSFVPCANGAGSLKESGSGTEHSPFSFTLINASPSVQTKSGDGFRWTFSNMLKFEFGLWGTACVCSLLRTTCVFRFNSPCNAWVCLASSPPLSPLSLRPLPEEEGTIHPSRTLVEYRKKTTTLFRYFSFRTKCQHFCLPATGHCRKETLTSVGFFLENRLFPNTEKKLLSSSNGKKRDICYRAE